MATLTVDPPGFPFGSVVSYAVDEAGDPLFFISELAEHTRNLHADSRASLLATEPLPPGVDPLSLGRVTLIGTAEPVPDDQLADARRVVVERHPAVAGYADYGDFSCWRLAVRSVRWVGGFGRMNWLDVEGYRTAIPDPVLAERHGVIEHMNADHADAGVLLCQRRPPRRRARRCGRRHGLVRQRGSVRLRLRRHDQRWNGLRAPGFRPRPSSPSPTYVTRS